MKTVSKHINWDTLIKYTYGIDGELDEYRKQRIGELTNRAFIIQQVYLFLSMLCYLVWQFYDAKSAIIAVLSGQLLLVFGTQLYISHKLEQDGITILEVDPEQFEAIKKKRLRRRGLDAIIFFLLTHLTSPLFPWVKESFWTYVTSGNYLFYNILKAVIFWRVCIYYTKKHLQQLPKQD